MILMFFHGWLETHATRKFLMNTYLKELVMESLAVMYTAEVRGRWLLTMINRIFLIIT